jgi:hypothetical protein
MILGLGLLKQLPVKLIHRNRLVRYIIPGSKDIRDICCVIFCAFYPISPFLPRRSRYGRVAKFLASSVRLSCFTVAFITIQAQSYERNERIARVWAKA